MMSLILNPSAFGQNDIHDFRNKPDMDTSKLTDPTIKSAFEALQSGNRVEWKSQFAEKVTFTDDGNQRDFDGFSNSAIGQERFTSIEKIENEGKFISGNFHSDIWGDFKVFFKFHLNGEGKIDRLDIGQAN